MAASWNSSTLSMVTGPLMLKVTKVPSLRMSVMPVSGVPPLHQVMAGVVKALKAVCVPLGQKA